MAVPADENTKLGKTWLPTTAKLRRILILAHMPFQYFGHVDWSSLLFLKSSGVDPHH
jgi:hypothetical protein